MRYLPYGSAFALFMTPFLTVDGSTLAAMSQPADVGTSSAFETRAEDPSAAADEVPSLPCDFTGCP